MRKVNELERNLEELQKLQDMKSNMNSSTGITPDNLISLITKQEVSLKKITELEKEILDFRKILSRGEPKPTVNINQSDTSNQHELEHLKELFNSLRKDLENLRNSFLKYQKDVDGKMKFKADLNRLNELEKILMDQLNEQMNILNGKIDDMKKVKLQQQKLEANMKKLQDFVMDQLANVNNSPTRGEGMAVVAEEEEAMFSKRPLLGMSCASCDKDILNLYGRTADYNPWSRMP